MNTNNLTNIKIYKLLMAYKVYISVSSRNVFNLVVREK